jgi:hypothetical protein
MPIVASDFLGHGYLPKHLPPGFSSGDWGSAVVKHKIKPVKHPETSLIQHGLARPGTLPRLLSLPHPAHYHHLAELVTTNWKALAKICGASTISLTSPRMGDLAKGQRAIEPEHGWAGRPPLALERRSGRRFMLKADISQCWPSMYTHALSWAIQGKPAAKAASSRAGGLTHYADLIDKAVRDAQERQSIGIPIGPDSSMVLSEVVLSKVDEHLLSQIKSLSGIRLIDEYELYFENIAQAEQARTFLAHALAEYRFMLNPRKTKVVELPAPLEPSWKHDLSARHFGGSAATAKRRIRSATDAASAQRQADPESRSVTYLLAMLAGCKFRPDAWPLVQNVAMASLEFEENSLPKAARLFLMAEARGWPLDKSRIHAVLNRVVLRHAPLRHGNSVCWALWLMVKLSIRIEDEAANAAGNMEDAFVLTVLGHAKSLGLAPGIELNALAKARNGPGAWTGPDWLCLYEYIRHGWLGPKTAKVIEASLRTTPYLSILNKRGVSFYSESAGTIATTKIGSLGSARLDAHAWATIDLSSEY